MICLADRYIFASLLTTLIMVPVVPMVPKVPVVEKTEKRPKGLPKRLERLERLELIERPISHLVKTARRSPPTPGASRAEYDGPHPRRERSSRWEKAARDDRAPIS